MEGEEGKKREEGEGTRRGRTKGEGKGEPEHFVKQGKMRLRRGTTATFLSLQNYVFRGPPPYLSKHNKFPLCLSRSSSTSSSAFSSSATPALPRRLFFRHSPRVCNRDMSVLLPCRGHASASRNASPCLSRSTSPYPSVSVLVRAGNIHTHTPVHVFPRIHPRPSFPSDELVLIGAATTEIEYSRPYRQPTVG